MPWLYSRLPYCGAPPAPEGIFLRWNLDPLLITVLLAVAAGYALASRRAAERARGPSLGQASCFYAGWAIGALALISPLCPLSVSLFAARVSQHMLLTLVAAPLIMMGRPLSTLAGAVFARRFSASAKLGAGSAWTSAAVFAAVLWLWHAPAPYAVTFSSTACYWAMHLSLIGAALWLWRVLLDSSPRAAAASIICGLISSTQMGFLGAVITLAPKPLYSPHALTTAAWGLTPLQDQQLGGAIMWIPGCSVFLAVSFVALWRMLSSPEWRSPGLAFAPSSRSPRIGR